MRRTSYWTGTWQERFLLEGDGNGIDSILGQISWLMLDSRVSAHYKRIQIFPFIGTVLLQPPAPSARPTHQLLV